MGFWQARLTTEVLSSSLRRARRPRPGKPRKATRTANRRALEMILVSFVSVSRARSKYVRAERGFTVSLQDDPRAETICL